MAVTTPTQSQPRTSAVPRRHRRGRWGRNIKLGIFYLILGLGAGTMIIPFIWMVLTSLRPESEIFVTGGGFRIFPTHWAWDNYIKAMQAAPFGRYFLNTVIYAVSRVVLNLTLCSMAAYAFARLRFPGKSLLFWAVLATMMIPGQITMIPVFILLKKMPLAGGNNLFGAGGHGWLNTYWGLIIPGSVGAFGIFLLRQFFSTLPTELEDAARIDGCSEFGIYRQIVLPMSKPVLATLGIFTFTAAWNDFIWPLIIVSKESMKTLQIGLQVFQSQYATRWDLLLAGTVTVTVPILVVFLIGQRYFTHGIALPGMKG